MNKYDRLVAKVELFERLALYGDRKSFLQALGQAPLPTYEGHAPGYDYTQPPPVSDIPPVPPLETTKNMIAPVTIYGKVPVNPAVQKMLNDLLVPKGDMMPLEVDGDLGPMTRGALKAFTARFNLPATSKNIKQMHDQLNQGTINSTRSPTGNELNLAPATPMAPGTTSNPLGNIANTGRT